MNRKHAPGEYPAKRSKRETSSGGGSSRRRGGWARTAGLLFLAASAVYNGRAIAAGLAKAGTPASSASTGNTTQVVVTEDAGAPAPAAVAAADAVAAKGEGKAESKPAPATQPADKVAKADAPPATQPSAGKSVSASEVAVSKDAGTVEIHVNDANIIEVLRMLSMQSNTNILPSKEVRGAVTVNLYDMTIKEALDAILKANGYGYREKGNVIYVYSAKEIADLEKSDHKLSTEVFHLYYTPAVNAQTMIKPVLSSDGQVAVTTPAVTGIDAGGTTSSATTATDTGGNTHAIEDMMVVTDYPENIERVRKILKDIDRRPQQLLVEATILRCALSEDNNLGVDFALLGGVDFHGLSANGSSLGDALSGNIVNNTNAGAGKIVDNGFGGASTGFTGGVPTGGLRAGIITNNVAVFVSALEEVTNTVVMANPKVLVLNKQKGEVKVARQDPFRGKTTVSETGLTQQEVDFLETGTMLVFRPYIGDDGYIRLEVHPEDSTPLPARAPDLPPTKLTTETTTNIMVKDGHTVVIGGLFRETSQTSKSQVPGIGNIPILGNLFKNQIDTTNREEVIILLTPHIIKDDSAFSKLSEEQQKEAERLRVGVRRGMMPFGRERLAECEYDQAIKEWNKPNPDRKKVLWHLDCAINLNPSFAEAIALKSRVTGKEVTSVDNSTMRGFVKQMVLLDMPAAKAEAAPATPDTSAAAAPTTQPSSAPVAVAPATQPSSPIAAAAPATQPSSGKPAAVAEKDPIDEEFDKEEMPDELKPAEPGKDAAASAAVKPATQPSEGVAKSDSKPAEPKADSKKDPSPSEVTVVPLEEVKDDSEKSDK